MKFVRVTTNLLDMRAKPSHDAERTNQVLFDALLVIAIQRNGFVHVHKSDGYEGWVDRRFLVSVAGQGRSSKTLVTSPSVRVSRTVSGQSTFPQRLLYGTADTEHQEIFWPRLRLPQRPS